VVLDHEEVLVQAKDLTGDQKNNLVQIQHQIIQEDLQETLAKKQTQTPAD